MLDDNGTVSPTVRDAIVAFLWAPVIIILWGLALGIALGVGGIGWTLATSGRVPDVGGLTSAVDPTLLALGIAGGVGYLYLMLANETFGTDTVEAAQEQAEDLEDDVSR